MRFRPVPLAITALIVLAAPGLAEAKPGPKFRVKSIAAEPSTVEAGKDLTFRGSVRNGGKAAGKANVRIMLRGPAEIELATLGVRVPAKASRGFNGTATVPGGTAPGPYTLLACVPKGKKGKRSACRSGGRITVTGTSPPPKQYTPGARTVGDPLFPQIGNGGYDVRNYSLALDYVPGTNVFESATTTISAVATQDLSEFSLDFQMDADSVTVNGALAAFQQIEPGPELGTPNTTQPRKLIVTPPAGIDSGGAMTVVVTYDGTPVRVVDADESSEGWIPACATPNFTGTCDGAFVVNQPNGAQGWFPNNNTPTDKATFDTAITVPTSHMAVGVGELGSRVENGDGTWTWNWSEDDPTPTYLSTATVGIFDYALSAMIEESTNRALPVYDFVDSSYPVSPTKQNLEESLAETPAMLNYLSGLYGPYPYDSTGAVVDRTVGVGYALEVQTKPHYSQVGGASQDISSSTQLHELAHQWMGNTATAEQWTDLWFNEGWAQWSEWIWAFDTQGGDDPAEIFDELYATSPAGAWEVAPAVLDGDPALMFSPSFPTYDRGAMVVQATKEILGDEGFEELIERLMTDFRYGNISTQEYIGLVEELSGFTGAQLETLRAFLDQWLYGEEKPTILPEDVTAAPIAGAPEAAEADGVRIPRGGQR